VDSGQEMGRQAGVECRRLPRSREAVGGRLHVGVQVDFG